MTISYGVEFRYKSGTHAFNAIRFLTIEEAKEYGIDQCTRFDPISYEVLWTMDEPNYTMAHGTIERIA
jgi:hypothetical protein